MKTRLLGLTCAGVALAAAGTSAQVQWQDVIRNLRHPNPESRLAAIDRLERGVYAAAAEPLAPLVADPDDRVQAAALDAELTFFLNERVSSTRVIGIGDSKSRAQHAFEGGSLLRTAMPAPDPLIARLIVAMRDENPRVRFDAVHVLGFVAEPPVAPAHVAALAAELEHYDPVIRMATARVLGRWRARSASEALMTSLGDSNETVRAYAIEALGLMREDRALPTLRDLARRNRDRLNGPIQLAIARIGSPDDIPVFRQQLASSDALTRRAAVEGLGRANDSASKDAIRPLLTSDRSSSVRLAAAFALEQLGEPQPATIATALGVDQVAPQARDYLVELGRTAIPGLQRALESAKKSDERADLVLVIGLVGAADDVSVVEPFLKNADARVARAATIAVTRLRRR